MVPILSGTSSSLERRCGRSCVESPLQHNVPYNFQIRLGLKTERSIATSSVAQRLATHATKRRIDSVTSGVLGASSRYSRCAPLPESARIGSPHPAARNSSHVPQATTMARPCSRSVELMPAGRMGSKSNPSQRRRAISLSLVVCFTRNFRRLFARASNAGLHGFSVM
jgi:hypothetical protein